MTDARDSIKQVQLEDVQENFEQIFEDVLGVQAGGTVRFVISDNCVQIIKAQSMTETTVMLGRSSQS